MMTKPSRRLLCVAVAILAAFGGSSGCDPNTIAAIQARLSALKVAVEGCDCSVTPPSTTYTTTTTQPKTSSASDNGHLSTGKYDLPEVLHKSILFYEAQRSGKLPTTNRVPWRGDSALQDKGANGEDLTGGWYDAGDLIKFGFPQASAVTVLAWGLVEYRQAYEATGELTNMLDSIRWPLDYFIKCHVEKDVFYGQVGVMASHNTWGRAEDITTRPVFKLDTSHPGSELAAETAAAMAASSIAFKPTDATYAQKLLKHAKELYDFAYNYKGSYVDAIGDAKQAYDSSYEKTKDEMAWAALWLYRATEDNTYLIKAEEFLYSWKPWEFSWADKIAGAQLLFYKLTTDAQKKATYKNSVETFLRDWFPGGSVKYTPKGLAWRLEWGSLRYSANVAFIALVAADYGVLPEQSRQFAQAQIYYMLGDSGRSFVVGFGNNPPVRPHHSGASCPAPPATCDWSNYRLSEPNPHVLYGALVGGPDQNDSYVDDRKNFQRNEVACDYNAGFQSAIAGLIQQYL